MIDLRLLKRDVTGFTVARSCIVKFIAKYDTTLTFLIHPAIFLPTVIVMLQEVQPHLNRFVSHAH